MKEGFLLKTDLGSFYTISVLTMTSVVLGACCGGAVTNFLPLDICEKFVAPITEGNVYSDRMQAFCTSLFSLMKPAVFIWVCGLFKFSAVGIVLSLMYKGGVIGFFVSSSVLFLGIKLGALMSASSILPHTLLYLPTLSLSSYFALDHSKMLKRKMRFSRGYFYALALICVCCAVCALCDAYVTSHLLLFAKNFLK